jgi:hypothetical protein
MWTSTSKVIQSNEVQKEKIQLDLDFPKSITTSNHMCHIFILTKYCTYQTSKEKNANAAPLLQHEFHHLPFYVRGPMQCMPCLQTLPTQRQACARHSISLTPVDLHLKATPDAWWFPCQQAAPPIIVTHVPQPDVAPEKERKRKRKRVPWHWGVGIDPCKRRGRPAGASSWTMHAWRRRAIISPRSPCPRRSRRLAARRCWPEKVPGGPRSSTTTTSLAAQLAPAAAPSWCCPVLVLCVSIWRMNNQGS